MAKYLTLLFVAACSQPQLTGGSDLQEAKQAIVAPGGGDIRHVALWIDAENLVGHARYEIGSAGLAEVWLEASELRIDTVLDAQGQPLDHLIKNGRLIVPAQGDTTELYVSYAFADATDNASHHGYSASWEAATTWPNHCDALFPCHSHPSDGMRYSLEVVGKPAIYMPSLDYDAPAYMVSFTTGAWHIIQTAAPTQNGTFVRAYLKTTPTDEDENDIIQIRDAFDWYEQTLGAYHYGSVVGAVRAYSPEGCMEHHPFWHCTGDVDTNRHEAAHGWFGNAVRIGCWEDIVVSEAFTEYLAQRVGNALAGRHGAWQLDDSDAHPGHNGIWVPESCAQTEPNTHWMGAYTNGPSFLKEIANAIGLREMDRLLGEFYRRQQGQATRLQDYIDFMAEQGLDVAPLANKWLR